MKKLLSVFLCFSLALCLFIMAACGDAETGKNEPQDILPDVDTPDVPDEPVTPDTPNMPDEQENPEQQTVSNFDASKFHIGVYYMGPKTLENAQALKKLGVDMIIDSGFTQELLDYFDKNDMGVIASGYLPGWWGGDTGDTGGTLKDTNSLERYAAGAAAVADHPAIWGVDCGDEPNVLDFPYYGEIVETVSSIVPQLVPYVNLYPGYASNNLDSTEPYSQLGTDTFEEYIRAYVENVNTTYISYDNYPFGSNVNFETDFSSWYGDLEIVSTVCREYDRDMWIIVQVNNKNDNTRTHLTKYQLQFQAYQAMAYGAKVVSWACYYPGWWYNNVLNSDGTQSVMYEILRGVNKNINGIADEYMKYETVATHLVGFAADSVALYGDDGKTSTETYTPVDVVNTAVFKDVKPAGANQMVIGEMVSNTENGAAALMVADASYQNGTSNTYEMTFRADGNYVVTLHKGTKSTVLTPSADGLYHVTVEYCDGFLITAETK